MNGNKKKSKKKDDFCKKMGLGLKMLIQQESKKKLESGTSRDKRAKSKGKLVKKGIYKNKPREDKAKRRDRNWRRAQTDSLAKRDGSFRLSRKFQTRHPEDAESGSQEPLTARIQKVIESVSRDRKLHADNFELRNGGIRIEDLEKDGIITPKLLSGFGEQFPANPADSEADFFRVDFDHERNRILEEEIENTGIFDGILNKTSQELINMVEQMHQSQEIARIEERPGAEALEVVPEDEERELAEREKDPLWAIKQGVEAKLNQKLDLVKKKQKQNPYEFKMNKLKREGKDYLYRKSCRALEPEALNKEGSIDQKSPANSSRRCAKLKRTSKTWCRMMRTRASGSRCPDCNWATTCCMSCSKRGPRGMTRPENRGSPRSRGSSWIFRNRSRSVGPRSDHPEWRWKRWIFSHGPKMKRG